LPIYKFIESFIRIEPLPNFGQRIRVCEVCFSDLLVNLLIGLMLFYRTIFWFTTQRRKANLGRKSFAFLNL